MRDLLESVCAARGFCGPFRNVEQYAEIPGWAGLAECERCGSTVDVQRHRKLRRRLEVREE